MLLIGGTEFLAAPAQLTAQGRRAHSERRGAQSSLPYGVAYPSTGVTPAMCMRLTGIGSQYIMAMRSGDGQFLDGSRNYRLTLPPDSSEGRFWSIMLYDRQTR